MIGQLADRPVTYPTQSFLRFVTFVARNLYAGATGTTSYFSPILSRVAPILMAPTFFPFGTFGTTLATYILEPLEPSGTLSICGVFGLCGLARRPSGLAPLEPLEHFLFLHLFCLDITHFNALSVEFSITSTDNHWSLH